jgi:hypothetical protein
MKEYRKLTQREIAVLRRGGCRAQDWKKVLVRDGFDPHQVSDVTFAGTVKLGLFDEDVDAGDGFLMHSGIHHARLRDVEVGDNTLIDNIGNYVNNYTIGARCYIANVCLMTTTPDATYGEGRLISVLNEVGDGNVILSDKLTSQLAAIMVKYAAHASFTTAIRKLVMSDIEHRTPVRGTIGDGVRIVNTTEIINTVITDGCVVSGASRLCNCSIMSIPTAGVRIGNGVICENSIIFDGTEIRNSVKLENCFVGEACTISNGFTAESSIFFANSYMSNGEACAAFCGPFSASHHKSSLLIGGMFSFYNAGSGTNFSNHAYKMGPMHYGTLERGSKTASGAYLLMPATIGAFSVCFGKLMYHPDTRCLPFSYLIAYSDTMYLVPGRNIATVGLYRDIRKWPKRDKRPRSGQKSIVNFDWLSPFTVGEIVQGKRILEQLRAASGDKVSTYNYHEYVIKANALKRGIEYYDMALKLYMGRVLMSHTPEPPESTTGTGEWSDLAGLLLPNSAEKQLVSDVVDGTITDIRDVLDRFAALNNYYEHYRWAWSYRLILDYYGLEQITDADVQRVLDDYHEARRMWIGEIKHDAEREFALGDVEPDVYHEFVEKLSKEL